MMAAYVEYEKTLIDKCARCYPFGVRVCNFLKAAPYKLEAGILGSVFDGSQAKLQQYEKEDRWRKLVHDVEMKTSEGRTLPTRYKSLRVNYHRDLNFLLETLSRLGDQLKHYPHEERNYHLRKAINEINAIMSNRVLSRGAGKQVM